MGLAYNIYLTSNKIFGCKQCKTHLADYDDIISRNFRGQHGKAYLFGNVVNITSSEAVERSMTTGRHIVRDIHCRQCKETVGWKYDKAYEASEKYKEVSVFFVILSWRNVYGVGWSTAYLMRKEFTADLEQSVDLIPMHSRSLAFQNTP
ncbi:hypothetical protein CBS115989_8236 [Aspergillus niger]|nr:hypothetical protein CBS115989_8236 [Aspergillus niger]KAI2845795.1 hypothetical protein CBS11232_7577 [Aspergillus niger]